MTVNHTAKTATFSRVSDYYRDLAAYRLVAEDLEPVVRPADTVGELHQGGSGDPRRQPLRHLAVGRDPHPGRRLRGPSGRRRDREPAAAWGSRGAARGGPDPAADSPACPVTPRDPSSGSRRTTDAWSGPRSLSRTQNGPWETAKRLPDHRVRRRDIPPDIFATEPPAGYTAKNSKATAPAAELRRGLMSFNANGRSVEFGVLVAFTLSDGSVIAGWQSRERQNGGSQEPLFANLTFGGPLPKLPVEIHGLRPTGRSSNVTYIGHHLAYTRKADRFTEWSLYVPTGTPPAIVRQAGYDAVYRLNPGSTANAQFGMTVDSVIPIKTAEDFDKWVGGAMAELSDNGKAAESLTYQKVTELAQRLRTPAKP